MKGIENIVKKGSSIPLFLQNVDVKKKNKIRFEKKASRFVSYKVLISSLLLFLLPQAYSLNGNFIVYCANVNKAELSIIEGKVEEALNYYDLAFSIISSPLAKDIHNAIVCSQKINAEDKIKKYLNLMVTTKSLVPKYYKQEKLLKYFSAGERKKVEEKYATKIHNVDYIFVQNLIKEDQSIRTANNYRSQRHLIINTDKHTFEEYKAYFNHSFLGEDMLVDFPCSQRIDYILFFHWFQAKFDVVNMTEEMVENFKFVNCDFAYLCELMQGSFVYKQKYGLVLMKKTKGKITSLKFSQEEIVEIDKNRAEIGLETYNEYVRKIDFFKKNKDYCYKTSYYIIHFG